MKKHVALLILFVLSAVSVWGQVSKVADVAEATAGPVLVPLPGAYVTVCTSAATPTNCPAATLYTDITGTTHLGTNVVRADNQGNYSFFAQPGRYYVKVVSVDGKVSYPMPDTIAAVDASTVFTPTNPSDMANKSYVDQANPLLVGTLLYPTIASAIATCPVNGCIIRDIRTGSHAAEPGFTIPPGITVELGCGNYGFTSTIVVSQAAHLKGCGENNTGGGTLIHPDASLSYGDIVANSFTGSNYWHGGSVESMTIDCFKATNPTGHGLDLGGVGESSRVQNVLVQNCHVSNIRVWGKGTPHVMSGVTSNTSDDVGFEFDFGFDGDSAAYGYHCDTCSGDNNAIALVRLANGGDRSTITFTNLKSERRTSMTTQNPVLSLESFNGTLNIMGAHLFTSTGLGSAAGDVVKISGAAAGTVNIIGASHRLYANWVNDTVNSRTVPVTGNYLPALSWNPGGVRYSNPNGYVQVNRTSGSADAFDAGLFGDANPRVRITAEGDLQAGAGTSAPTTYCTMVFASGFDCQKTFIEDQGIQFDNGLGSTKRGTLAHNNTTTRTWTFPDQTGTLAIEQRIDLKNFGVDTTGATDSSTAIQAAVTAAGNGNDIVVPAGLFQACNITFTKATKMQGVGRTGSGASYSAEPVRFACSTPGATVISQTSASGVNQLGAEWQHLVLKDSSNAGVGGGTGSIGFHVKNVNHWRAEDINVQDFSAGTGFLVDFNGATSDDNSYWTIDQPLSRNNLIGMHFQGAGSAGTVRGGEISGMPAGGKCFWLENNTNAPDATIFIDNTSCELSNDATIVGAQIETGEALVMGRFEGQSTLNNDACVRLTSTAHRNSINSEYNKCNIAVDVQVGAASNEVDLSRVVSTNVPIRDLGDGTLVTQANKQVVLNALNSGTRTASGWRAQRDSSGNTSMSWLLGSGTTIMRDSRLDVSCVSIARVSNVVTCTLPSYISSSPFAVASNITFEGASSSTFNISTAAVTAVGTSPATVSWAQVAADETALGGHVYMTGGTGISAPNSNSYIICAGGHGNSLSAITADDSTVTCMRISNGTTTFTADTGKTIGSSFTATTVATINSSGLVTANGGVQAGSTGTTLAKYARYSASLTPAAVSANTCAAQSFTVTGVVAGDLLVGANKPTEQAGLSVTPGHVTGTNTATLNFCNNTASPITPTAAETYQFVVVQ